MTGGVKGAWETVVENIREISKLTYVTLGMVFTEETAHTIKEVVDFGSALGVADIRVISAAQYNQMLPQMARINQEILAKHPILRYRVNNFLAGRSVRGLTRGDSEKCAIVLDDSAVAGNYHFPCVIYLRERGEPIGKIGSGMRAERAKWFADHNSFNDEICLKNCLDVCIAYNNRYRDIHET